MKRFISSSAMYAGAICILFSSCVSKRKYQDALNTVHRLKSDSAVWAQRGSTYEKNIATLQESNKTLQQQMESARAQSKQGMQSFRTYFDQQKKITEQLHQQLHQALDATGLDANAIHADNGKVYVMIPDNMLFTSGTSKMSTKGKDALTKLAEVLKSRNDIEVDVASNASFASYSGNAGSAGQTDAQQGSQAQRMDDRNMNKDDQKMKNANEAGSTANNRTRSLEKNNVQGKASDKETGKMDETTMAQQDNSTTDTGEQSKSERNSAAKNRTKALEKADQRNPGTENKGDLLRSVDQDRAANRKVPQGQSRNSENWSNNKMGQNNSSGSGSAWKSGAGSPSMDITKAATIVRLLMDNGVQPIRIIASSGDASSNYSNQAEMAHNKGLLVVLTPKMDGLYQLMSTQRDMSSR